MHSSNSTVMAAVARGAHWHEDRGVPSGILGRPGPLVRLPARAALSARPPRNEAAAQLPRPACHRRGASLKSAARARRALSQPGSVAKCSSLRPQALVSGPGAPTSRPPSFRGNSGLEK